MARKVDRHCVVATTVATTLLAIICGGVRGDGLSRVGREADAEMIKREEAIIQAAGMRQWPVSNRLTAAPVIDRAFLSDPDLITRESRSYDVVVLDGVDCGTLWIKWGHIAPSGRALPTELPEAFSAGLAKRTEGMPAEQRQRVYDAALRRYRKSEAFVSKGGVEVKMVVATSSRAAHEWLVHESTHSTLSTGTVAAGFGQDRRVTGLGDLAFRTKGSVRMVRGNVAVIVRARGIFVPELEGLITRIDQAIAREPELPSLQVRRPSLSGGVLGRSAAVRNQMTYSVSATASGGHTVA